MKKIWTEWLPDPVYTEVSEKEQQRFSSLINHLSTLWTASKTKPWPECFDQVLQIFPLLFQFMETKNDFQLEDIELCIKVSLEIILAAESDASALVRYGDSLSFHLRKYKPSLQGRISVEWRQIYSLTLKLFEENRFLYYGEDAMTALRQSLFSVVYNCGAFFPQTSAVEIWETLKDRIQQVSHPDCFVAVGWLATLLPAQDLSGDGWHERFGEMLELYEKIKFCSFWDCMWFEIFARCIKYDTQGLISWSEYTSRLFSAFLTSFNVPIGTATGELRYTNTAIPKRAETWFPKSEVPTSHTSAKCIIYLLRNDPTDSTVLDHLSRLVALLEQFYHPSNGGAWTGKLASFLKHLVKQLMRVISKQDKAQEVQGNLKIPPGVQKSVAELFMKMAARGHYSKQEDMRLKACQAISQLAYLEPQLVLPLVYRRFSGALESVTATATLAASVHALALSVRPMLMHGLHLDEAMDPMETAYQVLAEAMMDVLPGLDANDSLKTSTVFRFYAGVMLSLPSLDQQRGFQLPLDVEMWSEEILSRIFVLMENLEGPEARTDQSHLTEKTSSEGTFLSKDHVFFDCFLELFLIKLPASLQLHAIKRICAFLLSSPLPRMSQESSSLCAGIVEANASASVQYLVQPLIQNLLEDLPAVKQGTLNSMTFSHTLITRICWNLRLLGSTLCMLGLQFTVKNLVEVCEVLDRSLLVVNREIQSQGANLLESVFVGLIGDTPLLNNEAICEHILPSGILRWVSREPENWSKPKWHYPSQEEIQAAEMLTKRYLIDSLDSLEEIMEASMMDNGLAELCNSHLNKMKGVLLGVENLLKDFQKPKSLELSSSNTKLSVAGDVRVEIGPEGVRERLSGVLMKLSEFLEDEDPTVVSNFVEVIDVCLNFGDSTPPDDYGNLSDPDDETSRVDAFFIEPPVAHPYTQQDGSKCLKRRPYYLALTRVWSQYASRTTDASYLKWSSLSYPVMSDRETVPEMMGKLLGSLFKFTVHPYEEVAEIAHHTIEKMFKRFPYLTQLYSPLIFLPLIKQSFPEDLTMDSLISPQSVESSVFARLEETMKPMESDQLHGKSAGDEMDMNLVALQDAAVRGAVMLFSASHHAWNGVSRKPERTVRMIYALMGCRQHSTPISQAFSSYLIWQFLSRFVSPGYLQKSDRIPTMEKMRSSLCQLGRDGVLANWKYGLLANIFLLATLPADRTAETTLLDHFLNISISKLPLLRKIGLLGVYALLAPVSLQPEPDSLPVGVFLKEKLRDQDFVKSFVECLVEDHDSHLDMHSNGRSSQGLKNLIANGSFEEALVKGGIMFIDRFGKWPEGKTLDSILDGSFQVSHAHVIRVLGLLAPSEISSALKGSLMELTEKIQDQQNEKHELSALAEIMAGYTATGVPFTPALQQSSAWDQWYKKLFGETLGRCSLELGTGPFSLIIRYGSHFLLSSKSADKHSAFMKLLSQLLDHVEKTGSGQSTAEIKKLTFLANAITELSQEVQLCSLPEEWTPVMESLLKMCEDLLTVGFQSIREVAGYLMASLCRYFLSEDPSSLSSHQLELVQKVQNLSELMVRRFLEGVQIIKESIDQKKTLESENKINEEEADLMEEEKVPVDLDGKIGFACQFVLSAMHDPQVSCLTPILIQLLPGILQIQELGDSKLKPLQMEAVSSFASLKYIILKKESIQLVVEVLLEAQKFSQWHGRAAALVFLQVFWFHHSFLLTSLQSKSLLMMVVENMKDEKLEVQTLACSTLSGMLKILGEEHQEELRNELLSRMKELYPRGRQKKKQRVTTLTERHACVLGLKAFVMSHPYDIPKWMPTVLVAILPAANDPAPIKTTVTKTLGDFRRTHENESHQELRNAFDEEAWESIQAVGSCCSYFS